jgi:protein involved in polysaccharide export with SLBB domain
MGPIFSAPRWLAFVVVTLAAAIPAGAQPAKSGPVTPLPPTRSPFDIDASRPASTRLAVPAGSRITITIEIGGNGLPHRAVVPPRQPSKTEEVPDPLPLGPPTNLIPDYATTPPDHPVWGREHLKPTALPPIPDDPPPHEGALWEEPYIIEPPDLIIVEILEALPGRPITGERLVRPDGTISLGFYGDVHVRGLTVRQAKEKIALHMRTFITDEALGFLEMDEKGEWLAVEPKDTNRIFVDVTAYNSKNYFVQGDTAKVGKLPYTGKETVLDALQYSGGFLPSADPHNIRLIRPGRGGKPARVYQIDYEVIADRADKTRNLQLFPDDRLIIGRKAF